MSQRENNDHVGDRRRITEEFTTADLPWRGESNMKVEGELVSQLDSRVVRAKHSRRPALQQAETSAIHEGTHACVRERLAAGGQKGRGEDLS